MLSSKLFKERAFTFGEAIDNSSIQTTTHHGFVNHPDIEFSSPEEDSVDEKDARRNLELPKLQ